MEQSLIEFTNNIAHNHPLLAYIFFFISAALQILFPPYPGDTVLVVGGYISSLGYLSIYIITFSALSATFLSALVLYHMAYRLGDRIFQIPFISRYFSNRKLDMLHIWFKRYGSAAIFICKFIPGIGSLALIAAGIFKTQRIKAYISIGIAASLHNTILIYMGKTTGDNLEFLKHLAKKYNSLLIAVALIGIFSYMIVRQYQKPEERKPGI